MRNYLILFIILSCVILRSTSAKAELSAGTFEALMTFTGFHSATFGNAQACSIPTQDARSTLVSYLKFKGADSSQTEKLLKNLDQGIESWAKNTNPSDCTALFSSRERELKGFVDDLKGQMKGAQQ